MEHSQLESIWAELSPPSPPPSYSKLFIHSFWSILFCNVQFSELFCIIHPHTKPAPKSDVISPQRNPLKKTTAYNSFHFAFQECHSRAFSSQLPPPPLLSLVGQREKKTADQHPNFPVLVIRKIRPPTPPPPQAGQKKSTRRFIDNLMPQNEFTNKFSFKMEGGELPKRLDRDRLSDWGKSRKNEHGNVISAQ